MAGIPGIGKLHPLRRVEHGVDYLTNYDPFVHQPKIAPAPRTKRPPRQKSGFEGTTFSKSQRSRKVMRALKGK